MENNQRETSPAQDNKSHIDRKANQGLGWGEGYINPPMGPPDGTEKLLWKAYYRQLAAVQLAIHRERNTRMDTKIQRYFNSTPQKNALARVLYLSGVDKQLVTIMQVAQLLHTSRQATLTMLTECVEEGWATKTSSGANRYQGTDELVTAYELYGGMHFQAAINSGVVQAHAALRNYMEIADKQLSPLRQAG